MTALWHQLTLAAKYQPNDPVTETDIGLVLYHQKKYEESIATYQRVLGLEARSVEALNGMGAAMFGAGRVDDAIATYRKALEDDLSGQRRYTH